MGRLKREEAAQGAGEPQNRGAPAHSQGSCQRVLRATSSLGIHSRAHRLSQATLQGPPCSWASKAGHWTRRLRTEREPGARLGRVQAANTPRTSLPLTQTRRQGPCPARRASRPPLPPVPLGLPPGHLPRWGPAACSSATAPGAGSAWGRGQREAGPQRRGRGRPRREGPAGRPAREPGRAVVSSGQPLTVSLAVTRGVGGQWPDSRSVSWCRQPRGSRGTCQEWQASW